MLLDPLFSVTSKTLLVPNLLVSVELVQAGIAKLKVTGAATTQVEKADNAAKRAVRNLDTEILLKKMKTEAISNSKKKANRLNLNELSMKYEVILKLGLTHLSPMQQV